ncbi:D-serine deaminase-like pyridoxal phosphate-dependent protein [Murinocardiopsis flavida]|uniref:D-serine deaminase-like pyridoxal phosphate-dependent protein n=1 Tax=Murinocardiopsis flavida TaxID=645275 RepID=A0A2P8DJN2_9ACTN|nr:alanine racemase [Murinocardiopsis flavida]PSK97404.1 D-serine deaminase-like pyridoxal phosphate-dependent protein [Murinocardiopsis flavida]
MSDAPTASLDNGAVAALADQVLGPHDKAVPPAAWGRTVREYLRMRPTRQQFPTPVLTLSEADLRHNIATMAEWCRAEGVDLSPHGKTTMAPQLWQRQFAAGSWAVTLANAAQLAVARSFGVDRVHIANSVISPQALRWIADDLAADPTYTVLTWADSPRTVHLMTKALAGHRPGEGAARPIPVAVEVGGPGGRTGARTLTDALDTARAIAESPALLLAGVSGYEGSLAHSPAPDDLDRVRDYLQALRVTHERIRDLDLYPPGSVPVLTAGGSAYFELVTQALAHLHDPEGASQPAARVVLRSGAYIAHDDGFYRSISPFNRVGGTGLRSAMHAWVRVTSQPEPGLALFDAGKRDLPFDEGMPEAQAVQREGGTTVTPLSDPPKVTAVNDQHGYLRWDPSAAAPLAIGDEVRLGLSHPCTAFDKWGLIPVVADTDHDDPPVVDLVRTFF